MADIRQERPNEDPILNFDKILYTQSEFLNKKFSTHVKNSIVFKELEN